MHDKCDLWQSVQQNKSEVYSGAVENGYHVLPQQITVTGAALYSHRTQKETIHILQGQHKHFTLAHNPHSVTTSNSLSHT